MTEQENDSLQNDASNRIIHYLYKKYIRTRKN